ncbi:MFS transporter [Xaviernesmea oryzae]|uniref:MFS transporter n=1 Tax=Xaviernesmea oryzae TaxID=464029 RepID=A0A1Q9AY99_9HYPH|nr:RsmB/NOP family class I SAM-dependent RNA methyltransferase [Xaviernesmea oryzae]OLP60390.1 MFS transporter [Xaviernesmea oryzae]SEK20344.1 16S rRNA (cytosine967-C5)-methyltransferase [Xaviernesmea oryzae]
MNDRHRTDSSAKRTNRAGVAKVAAKPGLAARQAAARLLGAVIDKKTSLDGLLDPANGSPVYRDLPEEDRGLVRAILTTSLRFLPRIEYLLGSLMKTPLPDGARALQHLLVTAAAQILYLDVPDHAAVDLAVEQAQADPRNRRFAALVNAVLRRLSREKDEMLATVEERSTFPAWFDARLAEAYGDEAARHIRASVLAPAAIDLTVKADAQAWAEKLDGRLLPTGSIRLRNFSGTITDLPGYEEGVWWVQDAAASLPARLFGADLAGQRIVDLCAAPGGKTAQLILAGAEVTALDQSANRLKRLEANLKRLNLEAKTQLINMADFAPDRLFDAALLDAPCSSTGTIRRHPDVLWTKSTEEIDKLAQVQERLLRHALTVVRPGGVVVFSNCSLDPREGETMVARLIEEGVAERWALSPADWPGLEMAITPLGDMRTTPAMIAAEDGFAGGLDGFYAVRLRRPLHPLA